MDRTNNSTNSTEQQTKKKEIDSYLEDDECANIVQEELAEDDPDRKCRVCGCSWYDPCPGGCWWVERDLCSACADKENSKMQYEFVAVDFDGTLCEDCFPEIGQPNHTVIDYVKRLSDNGSKIILHTSREDGTRKLLSEAIEFCKQHEILLYAVNENPDNPYPSQFGTKAGRKVYADLYIDDKALNPADI